MHLHGALTNGLWKVSKYLIGARKIASECNCGFLHLCDTIS